MEMLPKVSDTLTLQIKLSSLISYKQKNVYVVKAYDLTMALAEIVEKS